MDELLERIISLVFLTVVEVEEIICYVYLSTPIICYVSTSASIETQHDILRCEELTLYH